MIDSSDSFWFFRQVFLEFREIVSQEFSEASVRVLFDGGVEEAVQEYEGRVFFEVGMD